MLLCSFITHNKERSWIMENVLYHDKTEVMHHILFNQIHGSPTYLMCCTEMSEEALEMIEPGNMGEVYASDEFKKENYDETLCGKWNR